VVALERQGRGASRRPRFRRLTGPGRGGLSGTPTLTIVVPTGFETRHIDPVVAASQRFVEAQVETYEGYLQFEQSQPEPPHKCD
jgi:hypothetical protein